MRNKITKVLLLFGVMMLLVACGNKGDLYLPDKEQPQTKQAT